MGLFAAPLGKSKVEAIRALRANADLWLEYAARGEDLDYLYGAMSVCLGAARESGQLNVTPADGEDSSPIG